MQSITVQSHISKDGILRLQVPDEFKDVDVQVTLALQETKINGAAKSPEDLGWPKEASTANPLTIDELEVQAQSNGWPPGYFRQVVGSWEGDPPQRPPQDTYEVRDEFP